MKIDSLYLNQNVLPAYVITGTVCLRCGVYSQLFKNKNTFPKQGIFSVLCDDSSVSLVLSLEKT